VDQRSVLFDPATKLYAGWYFWVRALDEVHRAARYGSPFALLLLRARRAGGLRKPIDQALSAIASTVRASDLAAVIGPGDAAILLPEQDAASAGEARDRIIARLFATTSADIDWMPTLYCYPDDAAEISQLIAHSGEVHQPAAV
jgi:GGDEF domain-containing protein